MEIIRPLLPHTHAYATVTVRLMPFVTRLLASSGEISAREHAALRWVPACELTELDLPEADRPIIAEYLSGS